MNFSNVKITNTMIVQYLRTISLLIAAFIFNAHMIIPHDHHQSDFDICQNQSSHHSDPFGFPKHCHAFNDLSTEKAINFVIVKYSQSVAFTSDVSSEISSHDFFWVRNFENCKINVEPAKRETGSLRAPPYTV